MRYIGAPCFSNTCSVWNFLSCFVQGWMSFARRYVRSLHDANRYIKFKTLNTCRETSKYCKSQSTFRKPQNTKVRTDLTISTFLLLLSGISTHTWEQVCHVYLQNFFFFCSLRVCKNEYKTTPQKTTQLETPKRFRNSCKITWEQYESKYIMLFPAVQTTHDDLNDLHEHQQPPRSNQNK